MGWSSQTYRIQERWAGRASGDFSFHLKTRETTKARDGMIQIKAAGNELCERRNWREIKRQESLVETLHRDREKEQEEVGGGGKGRKQHRYLKHSQGILQVVISNSSNFHESHNLPKLIKVKILTCFLSTSKIKLKIFSHTAVSKVRQPHWKSKCLTANC